MILTPSAALANLQQRIDKVVAQREKGNLPQELLHLGLPSIVAVSKLISAETIRNFYTAGQHEFGESYLQEALNKFQELGEYKNKIIWHFIGPLQSNKLRKIAQYFDWVHSVDSYQTALSLSNAREELNINHLRPLNICLQVNISGETTKKGIRPNEAVDLAHQVAKLPSLHMRGLMAIPRPSDNYNIQKEEYEKLALVFQQIIHSGLKIDTISAGMSNDFEAAIAAGATIVRVGSTLFGNRSTKSSTN